MDVKRVLPYIVGLLLLAFAFGSLPRSLPGGSIVFRSYWLLYLIYLGPIVVLAAMVSLVVLLALSWREIGSVIGKGMVARRRARKKRTWTTVAVWGAALAIAATFLFFTKKGIFGNQQLPNSTLTKIVGENGSASNPFQSGLLGTISGLVLTNWFSMAFLGLIVLGGVVAVQAIRVSLKSTGELYPWSGGTQVEGLQAVNEAIRLVDNETLDPRSRVISSYQRLVSTVTSLGTPAEPDMTARELERAICKTLLLKGSATHDLTQLFEEARYSRHEISLEDAERAHSYLDSIASELKTQLATFV